MSTALIVGLAALLVLSRISEHMAMAVAERATKEARDMLDSLTLANAVNRALLIELKSRKDPSDTPPCNPC